MRSEISGVIVTLTAALLAGCAGHHPFRSGMDGVHAMGTGPMLAKVPTVSRCEPGHAHESQCLVMVHVDNPISVPGKCTISVNPEVVYVQNGNPTLTWTLDAGSASAGYVFDDDAGVGGKRGIHIPSNDQFDAYAMHDAAPIQQFEPDGVTPTSFGWRVKNKAFKLFTYEVRVKHHSDKIDCVLDPVIVSRE